MKTRTLLLLCLLSAFSLQPSAFPQISTNKTFLVGTNNALPPNETNFFQVNSALLNAAVTGGGGGSASNATLLNGINGPATLSAANVSGASAGLSLSASGGSLSLTLTNVQGGITNSNTTRVTLSNDVSIFGDGITWPLSVAPKPSFGGLANFGGYAWFQVSGADLDSGAITTDGSGNISAVSYTGAHNGLGSGLTNSAGNGYVDHTVTNALNTVVGNVGTATTNWANATFATLAGLANQGATVTNWASAAFQPLSSALTTLAGNNGANLTGLNASQLTTGAVPPHALPVLPATNLDASLGTLVVTNCYHDGQTLTNCSITNGSMNLYCTSSVFTTNDVGKQCLIWYAVNGSGSQTNTIITNYVSANEVQVSNASTYTWSGTVLVYYGHDDTAALTNAFGYALSNNIPNVMLPAGVYFVNGPFVAQAGSSGYVQLPLPVESFGQNQACTGLRIMGVGRPNIADNYGASMYQAPSTNETILLSGLIPTGTAGQYVAMIGCPESPSGIGGYGFSSIELCLENLTIRLAPNPVNSAVDLSDLAKCQVHHVLVDVNQIPISTTQPTHTYSTGIKFPVLNNWATVEADDVEVIGYYAGYNISEHLSGGRLSALCCQNAIQSSTGYHDNWIGRLLTQGCPGFIYNPGNKNNLVIGEWDGEIIQSALPSWTFYQTSVYDTSGDQYGNANYFLYNATASVTVRCTNSAGAVHFGMHCPLNPAFDTNVNMLLNIDNTSLTVNAAGQFQANTIMSTNTGISAVASGYGALQTSNGTVYWVTAKSTNSVFGPYP